MPWFINLVLWDTTMTNGRQGTTTNQDEAEDFMQQILGLHMTFKRINLVKPNAEEGYEWEECWKYPKEDTFYFLLHGYLLFDWQLQNNVERYLHQRLTLGQRTWGRKSY